MRTDLPALLEHYGVEALLVTGSTQHNPAMAYLAGGGHLTQADLILPRGQAPILFHAAMERDEAVLTGLATVSYTKYPLGEYIDQAGGSRSRALALRYEHMLGDLGVKSGRVVVAGRVDLDSAWGIFSYLQQAMPGIELVGEADCPILVQAMATKDATEVERIRRVGRITTAAVAQVAEMLGGLRARQGVVVLQDGEPLRIGEVKRRINLLLAENSLENPEGSIFALGHDAGVPHSTGNPDEALRLGETIVFDIFPCEAGGGYFYDFTRTWCLGYAPDPVHKLYEEVASVYRQVRSELKLGMPTRAIQLRACELFEAQGHPTICRQPQAASGLVHEIGHGVGLNVHEAPWLRSPSGPADVLAPGTVIAIEPGLYYPDQQMGVRLEDTLWIHPDGKIETLAEYPYDLVLPLNSQ